MDSKEEFLKVLVDPPNADADIIAVHGLQPLPSRTHPEDTWTSSKSKKLWLSDSGFLPKHFPHARILLFGYNASAVFGTSSHGIEEQAMILLEMIKFTRKGVSRGRRIVFICHSLGGIIVKRALGKRVDDEYLFIQKAASGVAFFATPHRGGHGAALANAITHLVSRCLGTTRNTFLSTLTKDSGYADSISEDFRVLAKRLRVISFFETLPYKKLGLIVHQGSATIGLGPEIETQVGMAADHSSICKFEDAEDENFLQAMKNLKWLLEAGTLPAVEEVELDPKDIEFMKALHAPKAATVKSQIESEKGPILEESCTWLLKHPEYLKWIGDDSSNTLWIHGDAGKGKTVLALSIVDALDERRDMHSFRAHFFFDAGDETRNSPLCLLRSLLYQILDARPSIIHTIRNHFREEYDLSSIHSVWNILHFALEFSSLWKVYFIVDGVDECAEHDLDTLFSLTNPRFCQEPSESREGAACELKWLITSRFNPRFCNFPSSCLRIDLESKENSDEITTVVNRFIDTKVKALAERWTYGKKLKSFVEQTLRQRAEGTFLWVHLACLELGRRDVGNTHARKTLMRLPPGMTRIYRGMLERTNLDGLQIEILCAVVLAVCQPKLEELAIIAGLPEETRGEHERLAACIDQLCGSFLTIRDGRVYLIHNSVRDFVLSQENEDIFPADFTQVHRRIASRCVQYICGDAFSSLSEGSVRTKMDLRFEKDVPPPYLQYPALYWINHTKSASSETSQDPDSVDEFFEKLSLERLASIRSYRVYSESFHFLFTESTTLGAASYHGIPWLVKDLLTNGHQAHIDEQDDHSRTPLHWAAHEGYVEVVQLLLQHGAKVDLVEELQGAMALHLAADQGHTMVVDLLLNCQPGDVNTQTGCSWETPLHLASRGGHIKVVQLLLDREANINAISSGKLTALHKAAMKGSREVMGLLIKRGAAPEMKNDEGKTAEDMFEAEK